MTADKCPGDLNVLGSDEVSELFGWPVSLLDEIRELSDLAEQGEIWIDEWRRRDALLRASGPGQPPRHQVEAPPPPPLQPSLSLPPPPDPPLRPTLPPP